MIFQCIVLSQELLLYNMVVVLGQGCERRDCNIDFTKKVSGKMKLNSWVNKQFPTMHVCVCFASPFLLLFSLLFAHMEVISWQWVYKSLWVSQLYQTLHFISHGQTFSAGPVVSAGFSAHHSLRVHWCSHSAGRWWSATTVWSGKKIHAGVSLVLEEPWLNCVLCLGLNIKHVFAQRNIDFLLFLLSCF